jgi:hypothetical protein
MRAIFLYLLGLVSLGCASTANAAQSSMEKAGGIVILLLFSWPLVLLYCAAFAVTFVVIDLITKYITKWISGSDLESMYFVVIGMLQVIVFSVLTYLSIFFIWGINFYSAVPQWLPNYVWDGLGTVLMLFPAFAGTWLSGAYALKGFMDIKRIFSWYLPLTIVPTFVCMFFSYPIILILELIKRPY